MSTLTQRLGGRLEAAVFLALGGWCLRLLMTGDSWLFLHPRFRVLLAGSAFVCVFFGMLLMLHPLPRPHWRGMACLVLTIALGVAGQRGLRPQGAESLERLSEADTPAAFTYDGRDYLPLNLAELYLLTESDPPPGADDRFALQGMLLPDPEGLAPGVLLRLQIVCCLADAVGVGFRVEGGKLPPPDGRWVRLLGRLRPVSEAMAETARRSSMSSQFQGVFVAVVAPGHVFVVEEVQTLGTPAMPFIGEIRMEPPFAY